MQQGREEPAAPTGGSAADRPQMQEGRPISVSTSDPDREDGTDPTVLPPQPPTLNRALARNIEALQRRRAKDSSDASREEKIAGGITGFTGSMRFVYLHLALFGFWIVANLGWVPGVPQWDESFVVLAMIASVEAIFLSTFVLISQNRMQAAADKRADLDLQINLLAEHEVTKLVEMVSEIRRHLSISAEDADVADLKRNVAPEAVLDAIEDTEPKRKA